MIFFLKGEINYDVGSCHDARTVKIKKYFAAPNVKLAIKKAIERTLEYHGQYRHHTDYVLEAELFISDPAKKTSRKVWETRWEDAQTYVPPQPAIPARKAGFRSKRFK